METKIIIAVIGAAFLHAFWNFKVRETSDKALGIAAVMFGHIPLALLGITFSGVPTSNSWGFIVLSALLHLGYQVFLLNAYRFEINGSLPSTKTSPLIIGVFTILMMPKLCLQELRAS